MSFVSFPRCPTHQLRSCLHSDYLELSFKHSPFIKRACIIFVYFRLSYVKAFIRLLALGVHVQVLYDTTLGGTRFSLAGGI